MQASVHCDCQHSCSYRWEESAPESWQTLSSASLPRVQRLPWQHPVTVQNIHLNIQATCLLLARNCDYMSLRQNRNFDQPLKYATAIFKGFPEDLLGFNLNCGDCRKQACSTKQKAITTTYGFCPTGPLLCSHSRFVLFVLLVFNDTFSINRLYRVIGVWNIYCVGPGVGEHTGT